MGLREVNINSFETTNLTLVLPYEQVAVNQGGQEKGKEGCYHDSENKTMLETFCIYVFQT